MPAIGWSAFGGKIKNVLLMFIVMGSFLIFGAQEASADKCSAAHAGSVCIDTAKVTGTSGCVTGLCGGGNSVQCCNISSVACKSDGSSIMQPCTMINGTVGACNSLGTCAVSTTSASTTITTIPGSTNAATPSQACGPLEFCNPLGFSNVEGFLGGIMSAIQKIIVVLALVFIMIGAVMILTSAGNSGMVEKGKEAITMALVGLALGVAAPSLLKELANIIGWGGAAGLAGPTLSQIAVNVLNFLLGTMGILALIMMVIGAIMYLTSAGDEDRIDKGKEIFKYSVIGVLLAMSAMVLVTQVAKFFL